MKVVILCGGKGTRLKEETEFRPKPMVTIGGKPVLWHIMKIYAHYGYKEFIFCLGYKGNMIKEYFLNYQAMNNDFTVTLGKHNQIEFHSNHQEVDWKVTLVDTGEDTLTGSRIKKVEQFIDAEDFMVTYGDGVANVNIQELVSLHKSNNKIGTITGVHPSSRFGELVIDKSRVKRFNEKPQTGKGLINGGFFVFKREFFKYLPENNNMSLEEKPLEKLTADGELSVYQHEGFWQCVDTYRELEILNNFWNSINPPWKVW